MENKDTGRGEITGDVLVHNSCDFFRGIQHKFAGTYDWKQFVHEANNVPATVKQILQIRRRGSGLERAGRKK